MRVQQVRLESAKLPDPVFAVEAPPTVIWVDAYPIEWGQDHGTVSLPPANPIINETEKVRVKLIPYGAAKWHMAEFPIAIFEQYI